MVGELVLPDVIDGITEASITRKQSMPITRRRASTTARRRRRVPSRGAYRMEDRRADVAGGFRQPGLVVASHLCPRQIFDGRVFCERRLPHNFARNADRVGGDAPILRCRQIVRLDGRSLRRIPGFERERSAAGRPHIRDARRECRKRMQRLSEFIERKRLHVILDIGAALRWIRLGKSAKLRRRHGHRPPPAHRVVETHTEPVEQ